MSLSLRSLVLTALVGAGCATSTAGEPEADASAIDGSVAIDAALGPDACVNSTLQLLANADFEGGPTDWTETTNGGLGVIREVGNGLPFNPNDGTWAAIIGGFNNAQLEMTQTFTLPDDATLTRFAGAGCWVTEEVGGPLDILTLELLDDAGAPLATLLDLSNEDAEPTCDWTPFEQLIDEPTASGSLELRFVASTDGAAVSTFAFDSLAVEATVCR